LDAGELNLFLEYFRIGNALVFWRNM